jgi:hypothetical protein
LGPPNRDLWHHGRLGPMGTHVSHCTKSNSKRLTKFHSLYSYLASHLTRIHSLNCNKFQPTSPIRFPFGIILSGPHASFRLKSFSSFLGFLSPARLQQARRSPQPAALRPCTLASAPADLPTRAPTLQPAAPLAILHHGRLAPHTSTQLALAAPPMHLSSDPVTRPHATAALALAGRPCPRAVGLAA